MIGTRLGHYTLESCIGKGGMGEVYRALDTRLGRSVAIKILPPASGAREQSLRRFIQEAKTASSLSHPNIVTIHEIGGDGAVPFIVMEQRGVRADQQVAGSGLGLAIVADLGRVVRWFCHAGDLAARRDARAPPASAVLMDLLSWLTTAVAEQPGFFRSRRGLQFCVCWMLSP